MPEKFRKLQRISNHSNEDDIYEPRFTIDKVLCVGLIELGTYRKVFEVLVNQKRAPLKVQNVTNTSKPHQVILQRDCLI